MHSGSLLQGQAFDYTAFAISSPVARPIDTA